MKRILLFLSVVALAVPLFSFAGCAGNEVPRSKYEISAAYEGGVLNAEMVFTYHNAEGCDMPALEFNLYGNAYREGAAFAPVSRSYRAKAYYNGDSYGNMEIAEVSPCAAWEVCGQDENILRVELEKPVPPGGEAALTIRYTLTLAEVEHRTGIARHAVNLGNFYPVLCVYEPETGFYECEYYSHGDPFYSECADYFVEFTAGAEYVVAASGAVSAATAAGSKKTYSMQLSNARDFAIVLSDEFTLSQGRAGDVNVLYYSYDDEDAAQTLALLEESLAYFSDTFGEYPYQTYSAVQTGFCYGGMEYPALVMLSDSLERSSYEYAAVHETAHQWWYAAVGNNELEHAWLDEGLAEYSIVLFFEEHPQYGQSGAELVEGARKVYGAFHTVQEQLEGEEDTSMSRHLRDFGEYEYAVIAYDKGLLLFDTLRDALGEKRFLSALKKYCRENAGGIAAPETLKSAFGSAGGQIIGWYESGQI